MDLLTSIKRWFLHTEHPWSRLRTHRLLMDMLYFAVFFITLLITYSNILMLNKFIFLFIKAGSILLLILTFFSLKYVYKLVKNLKYGFVGLRNGYKMLLVLAAVVLLWHLYQNQGQYIPPLVAQANHINTTHFNPFFVSIPAKETTLTPIENQEKVRPPERSVFDVVFAKPEPTSDKTKDIAQDILKYTNIERATFGVRGLQWDATLAEIARKHSEDMAEHDYFDHVNLQGDDPSARAVKQGYNTRKELSSRAYSIGIAENIGKMPTGNVQGVGYVASDSDSIAKAQVDGWMHSPGHRANILNPQYDMIGVGVAYDGTYYVATQDFK